MKRKILNHPVRRVTGKKGKGGTSRVLARGTAVETDDTGDDGHGSVARSMRNDIFAPRALRSL